MSSKRTQLSDEEIGDYVIQEYLAYLVAKWAPRFGLDDWSIRTEIVRFHEMKGGAVLASVQPNFIKRTAIINVQDPRDWDDPIIRPFDLEEYIVHELVHVVESRYEEFLPDSVPESVYEEVVEQMTRALLRTDRSGEHGEWRDIRGDIDNAISRRRLEGELARTGNGDGTGVSGSVGSVAECRSGTEPRSARRVHGCINRKRRGDKK